MSHICKNLQNHLEDSHWLSSSQLGYCRTGFDREGQTDHSENSNQLTIYIIRLRYRNYAHYSTYWSCLLICVCVGGGRSLSSWFLNEIEENANIYAAVKSGSTVLPSHGRLWENGNSRSCHSLVYSRLYFPIKLAYQILHICGITRGWLTKLQSWIARIGFFDQ